jgi:hypothetical protein
MSTSSWSLQACLSHARPARFTGRPRVRHVVAATATVAAALLISPHAAYAAPATVGLWHFEDAGSTAVDSSGNSNTGTLKNVTTRVSGASGKAFGFSTTPSYVRIPSKSTLNPDNTNFKVTVKVKFTVKPPASVGDYTVIRKGLASNPGGSWKIEIAQDGRALCNYRRTESSKVQIVNGPRLNDGKWHTLSCAKTSTKVTLTVDSASYSVTKSVGTIANTDYILVGAKTTAGEDQFRGSIDEVSITKG